MLGKQQASDDSKSEYALELQKTNQAQREHYETVMPQIFQVCWPAQHLLPLLFFTGRQHSLLCRCPALAMAKACHTLCCSIKMTQAKIIQTFTARFVKDSVARICKDFQHV